MLIVYFLALFGFLYWLNQLMLRCFNEKEIFSSDLFKASSSKSYFIKRNFSGSNSVCLRIVDFVDGKGPVIESDEDKFFFQTVNI